MKTRVTAIFDIGKTNKKFFLFDENYREIHNNYIRFDELTDQEGFQMESLSDLVKWIKKCINDLLLEDQYEILGVNFSTYGASLVHLDQDGNQVGDFYSYLKPFDTYLRAAFLKDYGSEKELCKTTASPFLGMLNSALQLYYIKNKKPEIFNKIQKSLHFPQYLSYIFTQKMTADYTSMGCHTMFWDYDSHQYHQWLKEEGMSDFLVPVLPSDSVSMINYRGAQFKVGTGVHDSSAALLPYIKGIADSFVLISTGTWSICMNYFNQAELTIDEIEKDCLNFMSTDGKNVRAARLFLGNELRQQAMKMGEAFGVEYHIYKSIAYHSNFKSKRTNAKQLLFALGGLGVERFGYSCPESTDYSLFESFEEAYHELLDELTDLQVESLQLAIGQSSISQIYIDGGFGANELFTQMLANKLQAFELYSTSFSLGSALGAAMLVNDNYLPDNFMKENYSIKRHLPTATLVNQ
ncbi:FGGY family carbohydrate kinase [Reichenbachiella carrageenanivorans]|uniref:FGGY family carbohydrate kinase n=1 Tax=Reichenbachiella carrageenanivorans TaxID=2979869 RepID=A0ABY6D4H1_9BACT|nr:FGGY family carbohydrate kinase [Reichenbachiella carrageenanivorans]UXX81008.1 FGGY family carbohydrate kinase [Reichenbachiella carrageenanivorans]